MTSNRGEDLSGSIDSEVGEREELLGLLKDRERRHFLASVMTRRGLAEQIREIRLARGWTQAELARATGKVQETISQLENPDYGSYTLKTLQRLAEAFDVTLTVRFEPFSELVRWMTELTTEDLAVPDYEHDPGLHILGAYVATKQTANSSSLIREVTTQLNVRYLPLPSTSENHVIDLGYSGQKPEYQSSSNGSWRLEA